MPNMNNIDPKKWIVTFGKSIGYATKDLVVEKLPNAADLVDGIRSAASDARDAVDSALSGFQDDYGQISMNSIKSSSQYKDAMKAIDSAVSDIRSGNLTHAMELTDDDAFGDDLGFDFDLEEETTTDEDGNTVATIAGVTNDAKITARATIRGARAVTLSIAQLTEDFSKIQRRTTKGMAQSVVQATIVQTNLIHADLTGINKRLDVLNTNVASLVKLGQAHSTANEQASTHYARMEEAFTMMMKIINESSEDYTKMNRSESALENIVKYGFTADSFKALVKENIVRLGVDSAADMVKNVLGILKTSGAGFSDVFNIGMPVRAAIEKLLPKKTMAAIENFDRKIPRQLNVLLSRIGDLSDRGGILGTIGQLFGINIKPEARIDLGKYNKGATAWSGTSKKALEEVIPHYLASIDEVLHRTLGNDSSYEARYFDYDRGVFRASTQIRKDFHARMQKLRNDNYYDSNKTFEDTIKNDLGTYIVDDDTLKELREKISKLINEAVRSDMRTDDFAKKLIRILKTKKYGMNLSTASINEIVTAYISDMRKEKLMIAREMEPYFLSSEGSALRQLAIGEQTTGYNKFRYKVGNKWVEQQSNDIYGMYDFNLQKVKRKDPETGKVATIDNFTENMGELFYESSDAIKRRKELEEKVRKEKEEKLRRKEEIDKIAQKLPKGDKRYEYLMQLKHSIDQVSIISPKMDAWLASFIDGASLAIDDFVFGKVTAYDDMEFGFNKVKGQVLHYADQAKSKVKKYAKESRKIVTVDDFVRIINNTTVRGRYLNADMYDIHYIGDGENQRFDYAELYESDRYTGFPVLIRASDINLNTMKIKMRNVEKVPKPPKEEKKVATTEIAEASSEDTNEEVGSGWRRKRRSKPIGHGSLIVGHAAKAAETNATKSKNASLQDRIANSKFLMRQDLNIVENLQIAWRKIEKQLGGKEMAKAKIQKAGVGAGVGAALGLLSQFGLHLGPFFMPGGPIGGALLGAGAGILASKVDFKKVLFGEKIVDENGDVIGVRKTGLIDQWGNTIQTALVDNMKSEMHSVGNEVRAYWNAKMVPELEYFFQERSLRFRSASDFLIKTMVGIGKFIVNPFKSLNNAANTLTRIMLDAGVRMSASVATNVAKLGIQILRAPFKLGNTLGDLTDYGMRRIMLQGGINSLRGGLARLGFLGTRLAHPIQTYKGTNISFKDYRDRFGAFSRFGRRGPLVGEDGKINNADLDQWVEDKLADWEAKNQDMAVNDPDHFAAMREAQRKKLYDRTIGKRLNRQFRITNWDKRTSEIEGERKLARTRDQNRDVRSFRKLVNKYNRQDHSQFQNLTKAQTMRRYNSLAKLIKNQPEYIRDAFKLIDKDNPDPGDVENFILNPTTFAQMKNKELGIKEKDTRSNNFMSNVLHGMSSILNIMTNGKFQMDMNTGKEVKIPKYGNDKDAGDASEVEEKKKTEDKEELDDVGIDKTMEQRVHELIDSAIDKAGYAKARAKETYASIKDAWKNKKSPMAIYRAHKERSDAAKAALLDEKYDEWAARQDNNKSGQGWRRRPVGHGFLGTALSVGSKLLGGLKTAGSIAKNVGSKVWSGIKTGASVVSNFLGNNEDVAVDDAGNVMPVDPNTGSASYTNATEPKEATSRKDSSQSLSGSLKTGSDRSGNFSEAALDNSYKQNMLSGMNAALFLLSKGAYNPGFSLGKTGGSGSLQIDNVAKKEAQFEVAVGSTVSNLTEKATAAKTSNGKDANAPLVDGVPKLAQAVEKASNNNQSLFSNITNTLMSALPGLIANVLPTALAASGIVALLQGIAGALGIGDGGVFAEGLGNEDANGNRTAYFNENGELVNADDPNAQKGIIYNDRLQEKLLSKGTADTLVAGTKYVGKKVAGSKFVKGAVALAKGARNFAEDRYLDAAILAEKFSLSKTGQKFATFAGNAKNAIMTKAGAIKDAAATKVGSIASTISTKAGALKDTVVSKASSLAESATNIAGAVADKVKTKASSVAAGAKKVAFAAKEKASEIATSLLGKARAKVSESTGLVSLSSVWKKLCDVFDDVVEFLTSNSVFKSLAGDAAPKVIELFKKLKSKLLNVSDDVLQKFSAKIMEASSIFAKKGISTGIKTLAKSALFAVTAIWDVATGWMDAANLFYVNEDDVDPLMRTVSSIVKFLSNSCPVANWVFTVITLAGEIFEKDFLHWFATNAYNVIWAVTHLGDSSGNTLSQKQAEFAQEAEDYNLANGTNMGTRAYSDYKNPTIWKKTGIGDKIKSGASSLWSTAKNAVSGIFGGNKNKTTTETGHGWRRRSSGMVGHGRKRAGIVGHGAIDDMGNVDNSMMKGKYTGLQDNGTTIQNGAYYFAQTDPTWSGQTLAQFAPDTIGKSGCVMTSAAMGASTLLKRSINPSEFNSKYGNGNTSMNTRFGDLGLKVTRYPSANSTSSSHYDYTAVADVVTDALSKRKPVMLYGTKTPDSIYWDGGRQSKAHCVLATAMDANGNIIVNNPSSTRAQQEYGWKKTHPITSLKDVHWVQVMEKADGSGASGILDTSSYSSTGATAAGTNATSSYSTPATTGGTNESSQSSDPFTTAWSTLASGISALGGSLLSSLFKTNAGRASNETAPNQEGEDTIGHGRNYKQTDPSVANLPTGNGWKMKDGGCGVATIANMISGHGSNDLLQSSYSASMNHFVDGGLTGDGVAATLSDMGYDPRSVTDTNTLNSLLARGVHVAALGSGHGSSAFPKDSPHWVDLQGYDPFTGKYTWMDPEKGLRSGNLDPSEISSAITIGHGAMSSNGGKEDNSHMNVHAAAKKITAKIYTPTNLTSSEFNSTIDKTARSYQRDPNGFLWNKQGAALVEAEKKYGVNGLSLLGIAQTESGLNSSNKSISHNNATSIMGSNGLKTYGSPAENITGTGQLLGVKYKDWFGTTGTYDIAPHYCPDIPSINQYSSKWADNVTNYTTRFAAIAKGGDGSETQNIETDKGTQNAGPFSISDSDEIPSATISGSGNTYSSSGTTTSQSSSSSSDSGLFSSLSGISNLGGQLLSDLFKKNSGHGGVGHGTKARTGGVSANMSGTGGFVDDSIMGMQATDDSLVTGTTNSGTTSKNNNTKIVGKMDIIISILRAMLQTAQASAKSQTGHGVKPAQTSSSQNKTFTVGHGSESNGSLVRYRPTKTLRDRGMVNRYGSMKNISNPKDRNNDDSNYLRQVHDSISSGARKNLT